MFAHRLALCMLVIASILVVGCGDRQALDRYIVIGVSDSLQRREGINWGRPTEVLPPEEGAASWWQVSYADGPDGEKRVILVDDETGWARFPSKNYKPRVAASSHSAQGQNPVIQPGRWVLLVTGAEIYDESDRAGLEADVRQLNEMAEHTGLAPAFSIRNDRSGSAQIVYGWQKDHGMSRDEKVRDWLHLRTRFDHSLWIKLGDER